MSPIADLASGWPRISALLDEALNLEPPQRAAWLARLDGESAQYRDTLQRLLDATPQAETNDFLGTLPKLADIAAGTAPCGDLHEGLLIGPYRLVSELGRGGMGSVWLAERSDGQLKRRAALKLPHITWAGGLAERMARERDILATLDHPHIARLYDAGVDAMGRPWLALEHVQGLAIDVFARERALDVPARLALLLQVCSAVAYAHSRLVIHRDLKPSNILVTEDGQVRLLDFGIAKLVQGERAEATALTEAAGRALTPDYASPEQVRGEPLTTASDVYSLGVVAYELLTGQRPYRLKRGSAAEIEEAILSTEVPRASEVVAALSDKASLRGDLDAILNKALKKSVELRYQTIDALTDDFRRHLRQEIVLAQPDRAAYRLGKFLRRNRYQVASAAAIAAALAVGTGVSVWQAQRAVAEAARANEVKRFVLSLFSDADTGAAGGNRSTTAVDLLHRARERLRNMKDGDPGVASELLRAVGDSLIGLGELAEAQRVLEDALSLARQQHGDGHRVTAEARLALGELLLERGTHEQAAPHLEAAARELRVLKLPRELMNALRWLANLRSYQSRPAEVVTLAEEAAVLAETLPASDLRSRMLAQQSLSSALMFANRPGRVVPARKAHDLARQIHGNQVTVDVLSTHSNLAYALVLDGELVAGMAELETTLPQQIALLGPQHAEVVRTLGRLGLAALALGEAAAADHFARGYQLLAERDGDKIPSLEAALYKLLEGTALVSARRLREGDDRISRSIDMLLRLGASAEIELFKARSMSLVSKLRLGDLAAAEALADQLLPYAATADARDASLMRMRVGALRSAQARHDDALRMLGEARAYFAADPRPADSARYLAALGEAQLAAGRPSDALTTFEKSRMGFERVQPRMSPEHADLLVSMTTALLALSRPSEAITLAAKAAHRWAELDATNRSAGLAWLWLAKAQRAEGEDDGTALARAKEILSAQGLEKDIALLQQTQREHGG